MGENGIADSLDDSSTAGGYSAKYDQAIDVNLGAV
jgi:hypothetical protein